MVICLERGADVHMAQLVPASPGERAVKRVCVLLTYVGLNVSASYDYVLLHTSCPCPVTFFLFLIDFCTTFVVK